MTQQPENPIVSQYSRTTQMTRVSPKDQPQLTQQAVIWESELLLDPQGKKFTTGDLHDFLKTEIERDKLPVNICYAERAYWIIIGAKSQLKIDDDLRPRIVATLKNSPYTDIQFIAGIDYFGDSNWANIQMMVIAQDEGIQLPPKPTAPPDPNISPIIPNEALIPLGILVAFFLFSGNSGLQVLAVMGGIGMFVLFYISNQKVQREKEAYAQKMREYQEKKNSWESDKERISQQQEERKNNRLLRSFKWDDLRIFKQVISRYVLKVVYEQLIEKGAIAKDYDEGTKQKLIPEEAKKDIKDLFREFEG